MSAFSDEMAAVALDLITEFGEAISITQTTEGAYNSATASTATGSDTVYTGVGVPIDYTVSERSATDIKQGDVRLYINATSTVPLVGDKVTLDSVVYRTMNVIKYTINSENVMYELQLRI